MKDSGRNQIPTHYHFGHRERMREKFDVDNEMTTFRDHELLEFLLNTVIPRKDTNEIAHELIARCGSLYAVFNEPVQDLMKVKNMTVNAAYLIASLTPIMRRSLRSANDGTMRKIFVQGEAAEYFSTYFLARNTECLCVLYLNAQFKLIKTEILDELSPVSVSINIRKIAATAVKSGAVYVMLGHNHPSGSPVPSENDLLLIWDLFNALSGLGVTMLDNFIFVKDGFLSFRNVGIITKFIDEYHKNNPNSVLKENNMQMSLYLSNLKQYLIDVTKLKEENLVELISVQDFIERNREKVNDPRILSKKSSKNDAEISAEFNKPEIAITRDSDVDKIFDQVKDNFVEEKVVSKKTDKSDEFIPQEPYVLDFDMLFKTSEVYDNDQNQAAQIEQVKHKKAESSTPNGYMIKDFVKAVKQFTSMSKEKIPGSTRKMPIYQNIEYANHDKNGGEK